MKRAKVTRRKRGTRHTPKREHLPPKIEKALSCKSRDKRSKKEFALLLSIIALVLVFMTFSKYMIKTDLETMIASQDSACFSDQQLGSSAVWEQGNIAMMTAFETPDPCYRVSSVSATQQGNRVSMKLKVESGGICVQCFGYRSVKYWIMAPEQGSDLDLYVDIEGSTQHYVWLPIQK
ncbi:MAG: hypothetical protein NTU57_03360 [Candidatus Aenigmarchaeota archaeon]|nr:hypothetical protein [Candidatus Aenigmarchaeota archaeon]